MPSFATFRFPLACFRLEVKPKSRSFGCASDRQTLGSMLRSRRLGFSLGIWLSHGWFPCCTTKRLKPIFRHTDLPGVFLSPRTGVCLFFPFGFPGKTTRTVAGVACEKKRKKGARPKRNKDKNNIREAMTRQKETKGQTTKKGLAIPETSYPSLKKKCSEPLRRPWSWMPTTRKPWRSTARRGLV